MQAYVLKKSAMAHTHSTRVWAWLNRYNNWVPCTIQGQPKDLKPGCVCVEFNPGGLQGTRFRLQVPTDAVHVYHPRFKHSLPLGALQPILDILKTHEIQVRRSQEE